MCTLFYSVRKSYSYFMTSELQNFSLEVLRPEVTSTCSIRLLSNLYLSTPALDGCEGGREFACLTNEI